MVLWGSSSIYKVFLMHGLKSPSVFLTTFPLHISPPPTFGLFSLQFHIIFRSLKSSYQLFRSCLLNMKKISNILAGCSFGQLKAFEYFSAEEFLISIFQLELKKIPLRENFAGAYASFSLVSVKKHYITSKISGGKIGA